MQGNQRYYNNNNQRQGASNGINRNRQLGNYNSKEAPGTGAYLDRRLRGNDLDVPTAADFHFDSSNAPLEKENDKKNDENVTNEDKKQISTSGNKEIEKQTSNTATIDETNEEKQKETTSSNEQKVTTSTTAQKSGYDKKNFFDNITTDADVKKQQKQVNLEEQRKSDAETFGSVAESYRSRHGLNQQNNENNRNYNRVSIINNERNFNQRRPNYGYNQQKYSNNYRRNDNVQFDPTQQHFFSNNQQRWVQKRPN